MNKKWKIPITESQKDILKQDQHKHNVFHEYPDKGVCPICGKMTEGGQMVIVKEYHRSCVKEEK